MNGGTWWTENSEPGWLRLGHLRVHAQAARQQERRACRHSGRHSPRWERSSVGRKRGQTTRQAQSLDGWKHLEKRKDKPGQVRLWSQAGCAQCPSQISHTLKSRHTRFKNGNFTRSRSSMTRGGLTGVAGLVPFNLLYWVNKMFMVARRTSDKLCLICNKKNMKCKRQTSRRSA